MKQQSFIIPTPIIDSLIPLSLSRTEIGGGIALDKKKKNIIKVEYWISPKKNEVQIRFVDNRKNYYSYFKNFQIHFHTHPNHQRNPFLKKMPSPWDLNDVMYFEIPHLVFAYGYSFIINFDLDKLKKIKSNIRKIYMEKSDIPTGMYVKFFENLQAKTFKKYTSEEVKHWKDILSNYGFIINRLDRNNCIVYIKTG